MILLTPQQVADQLVLSQRTVKRLRIPVVRVGLGKGKLRYRQEDIDAYVRSRLEFAQEGTAKKNGRRISQGKREVGIPKVLGWKTLRELPVGNEGRS